MTFTVENVEVLLIILVRISCFIYTAPLFSIRSVPQRAKILLSVALSIITFVTLNADPPAYTGVIGFALLALKEAVVGLTLGLFTNIATYTLSFAGQMIDMNIGFSMMNEFDPVSSQQVTVTSNIYTYSVMLVFVCTDLHLVFVRAVIDTFQVIPLGKVVINENLYEVLGTFFIDFMVLSFRFILPIFAATLITNTVLAVLAKVAPQMNMFVIGHQLKIFVGLAVLTVMLLLLPQVCDAVFNEMMKMLKTTIPYFQP